jgi:branched-chain amino acid transport system substrate-binding protein
LTVSIRRLALVAGVAASLLAVSCGSDDSESASNATVDQQLQENLGSAVSATTAIGSTQARPTSMGEWEKVWSDQRAAIVKRIKDSGWGRSADGTRVTGPEGFSIDLTKCPVGWSDTEGLSDSTIKMGFTGPLSGPVADAGNILHSMEALYAYYNKNGGFPDATGKRRTVNFVTRDDGYDPARTIPLVDELLDSEKVFAIGTIGTPNQLKVHDKINQRCVAYPAVSNDYSTGDPIGHPWTTSSTLSYTTEAILMGKYVEQHLDSDYGGRAKIIMLIPANDLGIAYDAGFKAFLSSSSRKGDMDYSTQVLDGGAPVTDPLTTIASEEPTVFVAAMAGATCAQTITAVAQNGMKESTKTLMLGSACKSTVKPADMGSDLDGWIATGGGQEELASPINDNDAWTIFARQLLADAGYNYKASPSFGSGFFYGWYMPQALLIAGQLNGGLSRTNLLLALRSMDMTHPELLQGVKFNMNGNKDAFFVEGSDVSRWTPDRSAWVAEQVVDVSGSTKLCSWNTTTQRCT